MTESATTPEENRRLLEARWGRVRKDVFAGRETPAGVWAEMLVLAHRLGQKEVQQVAAHEMRRAVDRQTR